jgi:thiosulfate/3-mercaptopyruvate sulfurtransferase
MSLKIKIMVSRIGLAVVLFSGVAVAAQREIPAIISTDWLLNNLNNERLIILDIRSASQYQKGHIPGAVNLTMSEWAVDKNKLTLELPSNEAIQENLGKIHADAHSFIVVVNRTETDFNRVAWTIMLAGIMNVSVLDGGHNRWVIENKPISTLTTKKIASSFSSPIDQSSAVSKEYVLQNIGKAIIVDARIPEDFFGVTDAAGHIKSAINLPTPWVFKNDGRYRSTEEIQRMAEGVIGKNKSSEIIVYCGVGGFSSTWWFLLTQMLDYKNVKLYDGSFEEWTRDPAGPTSAFSWR